MDKPNPGGAEARAQGCLCPVLDNNHGAFAPFKDEGDQDLWYYVVGCPIHAPTEG